MPVIRARIPFMRRVRLAARASPEVARVLAGEPDHETGVVAKVPPPQPSRLLRQAERPLQTEPLQAIRRLAHESRVKVERGADADEYRGLEACTHARHPLLLQRHPEPD